MNKLFTKIVGAALGLTMAIGVGVAVASKSDASSVNAAATTRYTLNTASTTIASNNSYTNYGETTTAYQWAVTCGSKQSAGLWLGANNNQKAKMILSTGSYSDASGIATAISVDTSSTYYAAIIQRASTIANVDTVSLTYTTPGGTAPSEAWILYNDGTNGWQVFQKVTSLSTSGTDFTHAQVASARYAFVIHSTGYCQFKVPVLTFKGTDATTQTITGATSGYVGTGVTLSTNATSSTSWTITSNTAGATLSASTGTSTTVNATQAGSVTIQATCSGYTPVSHTITFEAASSDPFITPAKPSTSGYTGQNETLSFTYGNLTSTLGVSSSNTSVVTVGSPSANAGSGTVQINFVGAGSANVLFKDGSTQLASVSVSVTASSVEITGLPATKTVANGGTVNLGSLITVTPHGSCSSDVTWESGDDDIATVSAAGVVTGVAAGTVDITVTSDDYPSATMTCSVTVANMISAIFGSGTTDGSGLANDAAIKAVSGYTVDSNLEFSSIAAVYGSTGNALKLGAGSTKGTITIGLIDGKVATKNAYITKITVNAIAYGTDSTVITINGTSKTLTTSFADYDVDVTGTSTTSIAIEASAASKQRFRIQYINVFYDNPVELSSVTTSGQTTSFTAGNNFSYGGTLTAHYSDSTSATVTSSAVFKLDSESGATITTSTVLTKADHDGHEIYVLYTEDNITKSAHYTITVDYAAVTSVVIGVHAAEIGLNETYDDYLDTNKVSVTINSQYANQGYEWIVSANTVNDEYAFDESGLLSGDTEGTITLRCRSTADNSKYDELVVTVTGNPTADFTPASVSGYVGKSDDIAFTYGNMSDTSLISITSSNSSIAEVDEFVADEGEGLVTVNFVAAGDATLSISYDGGSTLDSITVTVSTDSVTALSWSAPTIKVYSGATTTVSDASSWNVHYTMASGDEGDLSYGEYTLKLGGSSITLPHTWDASEDGKVLSIEYGGFASPTTSTVDVTQSLQAVNKPNEGDSYYQLVSTDADLEAGRYLIVSIEDAKAFDGSLDTLDAGRNNFDVTISDGTVIANDSTASGKYFDLTVENDAWTITSASGANVGHSASGNGMNGTGTNTITISNGISTILGTGGKGLAYNSASGSSSERFRYYTSPAANANHSVSLFKLVTEEGEGSTNIANVAGHEAAQKAVVAFAKAMNAAFDNTANCTDGVAAAWTTASNAYSSNIAENASLSAEEKAYAKNLIKYASAQYTDDTDNDYSYCLERAMATYEVCIQKHGQTAFMSDVRLVSESRITSLSLFNNGNSNTVAIIVIISMISVTCIGGYIFLRKRKEN